MSKVCCCGIVLSAYGAGYMFSVLRNTSLSKTLLITQEPAVLWAPAFDRMRKWSVSTPYLRYSSQTLPKSCFKTRKPIWRIDMRCSILFRALDLISKPPSLTSLHGINKSSVQSLQKWGFQKRLIICLEKVPMFSFGISNFQRIATRHLWPLGSERRMRLASHLNHLCITVPLSIHDNCLKTRTWML